MSLVDVRPTIFDHASIRIAVVPVGSISDQKFKEFYTLIKGFDRIELKQITPEQADKDKNPLPNKNWDAGEVRFRFVFREDHQRSEWEEFQAHRKIYGVIGICHCPKSPDLAAVHRDFSNALSSYPACLNAKCFAFEPLNDQADSDDLVNLVMVPNADRQKLAFYLQTLLCDFAASLITKFDKWISTADQTVGGLSTPLDMNANPDDPTRLKKRRPGRLSKRLGDMALLSASPVDAKAHYESAIEQSRANADFVWLAGALEGLVCSILLINRASSNGSSIIPCQQEVVDRYVEAIANYLRTNVVSLEIEAAFKLGRYYCSTGRKLDVLEAMSHVNDLVPRLAVNEQVMVYSEMAALCERVGLRRKFAFYLRLAALLHQGRGLHQGARVLLTLSASQFFLPDLNPLLAGARVPLPPAGIEDRGGPLIKSRGIRWGIGWPALQMEILDELMTINELLPDSQQAVQVGGYALRRLWPYMDLDRQSMYAARLAHLASTAPSPPELASIDMYGFPTLLSCKAAKMPTELQPVESPSLSREAVVGGPFIYCHFTNKDTAKRKRSAAATWVQGELVDVQVELANYFGFEVLVQIVALKTSGVPFETYSTSVSLPASTRSRTVIVQGRPHGTGVVWIHGCLLNMFGITAWHPIDYNGYGITVAEHGALPSPNAEDAVNAVPVIAPLPLLALADTPPNSSDLSILTGQSCVTCVHIKNVGSITVSHLRLTRVDSLTCLKSEDEISQLLPLIPGQVLQLPFRLNTSSSVTSPSFRLQYSESASSLFIRELPVSFSISSSPPLGVSDIDVIPSTFVESASLPSPSCCPHIASVEQPRADSSDDESLLVFVLRNQSSHTFRVSCRYSEGPREPHATPPASPSVVMEPQTHARMAVPIHRAAFQAQLAQADAAADAAAQTTPIGAVPIRDSSLQTPQQRRERQLLHARKNLAERVRITWHSSAHWSGETSIERALESFTERMLLDLLPDPVTLTYYLTPLPLPTETKPSPTAAQELVPARYWSVKAETSSPHASSPSTRQCTDLQLALPTHPPQPPAPAESSPSEEDSGMATASTRQAHRSRHSVDRRSNDETTSGSDTWSEGRSQVEPSAASGASHTSADPDADEDNETLPDVVVADLLEDSHHLSVASHHYMHLRPISAPPSTTTTATATPPSDLHKSPQPSLDPATCRALEFYTLHLCVTNRLSRPMSLRLSLRPRSTSLPFLTPQAAHVTGFDHARIPPVVFSGVTDWIIQVEGQGSQTVAVSVIVCFVATGLFSFDVLSYELPASRSAPAPAAPGDSSSLLACIGREPLHIRVVDPVPNIFVGSLSH